jgi:2-polyprenyl-3-methyl-5-hydroxy-6-metoxy-1,4-benzoquinol methylase
MNEQYEKVKNFYNNQAKANPDSAAVLAINNPIEQKYRELEEWDHFKKIIPLRNDMDILEIGCGAGRWCFNIAPHVNFVQGIDISHEVISIANIKKRDNNVLNVNFEERNLLNFSSEKKFDIIYFSGVLLYIADNDLSNIIIHFSHMLSDGGYFIVRDTCMTKKGLSYEYPYGEEYGPCPVYYRMRNTYSQLFKQNGFELMYHNRSYNKIFPHFLINIQFLKKLYSRAPQKTLKMLHYIGILSTSIIKICEKSSNQFSHEFQTYKRIGHDVQ